MHAHNFLTNLALLRVSFIRAFNIVNNLTRSRWSYFVFLCGHRPRKILRKHVRLDSTQTLKKCGNIHPCSLVLAFTYMWSVYVPKSWFKPWILSWDGYFAKWNLRVSTFINKHDNKWVGTSFTHDHIESVSTMARKLCKWSIRIRTNSWIVLVLFGLRSLQDCRSWNKKHACKVSMCNMVLELVTHHCKMPSNGIKNLCASNMYLEVFARYIGLRYC